MIKLRMYGQAPYRIAVIHGGPGAPGGMKPVAKKLSQRYGVLEPLQSADTIDGQIAELKGVLAQHLDMPAILIGHSWGAWLSFLFAAKHPKIVKKLILIASGAFDARYVEAMNIKRTTQLTEEENARKDNLLRQLCSESAVNKDVLREFGELMSKADAYAPVNIKNDILDFKPDVFCNCMAELNHMRGSGELLNIGRDITCPVIAIHGKDDSHPPEGVRKPLADVIKDFTFIQLDKCGHSPWNEKYAKHQFYKILTDALK